MKDDNRTSNKKNQPSNKPKDIKKRRNNRKKEDRVVRKIVLIIVLALVIVGGVFGFSSYRYVKSSLEPVSEESDKTIAVNIPIGSSNKQIGEILERNKIIKSGLVFNYYTKFNNYDGFQAGKYVFSPSMTLDELANHLKKGTSASGQVKFTIPEGYDVDQIATSLAKTTRFKKKDFLALIKDEDFFKELKETYPDLLEDASKSKDVRYRLEGYLFPATYDANQNVSLKELVTQMVAKSDEIMSNYYEDIDKSDLNVHEVLTLASLVEKEGVTDEDRKMIAQVFFNRIDADMPLQSDISVLYALGEHKEKVYNKDLQVDSPYNLYQNTGYGPGPFNNPSQEAIEAVLNPTDNNYLYFVADVSTGEVYYANTFDEHNELVEKYVN
ncbi:MAG TPA: endolytic transglycosylase MltG [Tetragenococcus sp.]|nr:endolytic transglycosylase MltG [Tetragenococcus sp.]